MIRPMGGSRSTLPAAGVIYQIYPASFADGDGDGIGDLDGIRSRLPYLERLGADAVWLSPIYPSGGADGGYDVTDHVGVDPAYGDLGAFDRLVADAHDRGILVLLDFVPNHTSDKHPWFVESRSSRDAARRDWYMWRDPGPGGGAPNDWQSTFGGPAWRWDEATRQFAMTSFYQEQVDLNWENPEVRRAVTDAMRAWVERGVDGFRLDVVHRLSKGPAAMLNGPRAHEFVREIRDAVGPSTLLLGEVWLFDLQQVISYLAPGELDLAFAFPFAFSVWNPVALAAVIEEVVAMWDAAGARPCWHIANHDMPRPASRWGAGAVRAAAVLQMTLPGVAVVYQGDEIGMADGDVPVERRRDRIGRDPCRTPMRWDSSPNAGFCPEDAEPWLPVEGHPPGANVAAQEGDDSSILALYRRLVALRRSFPSLTDGSFRLLETGERHLAFERRTAGERLVVMVNMVDESFDVELPPGNVVCATSVGREATRVGAATRIEPNEALVVRADSAS